MSTINATNLKHASSSSNNIVLNSNGTITATNTLPVTAALAQKWARWHIVSGTPTLIDDYGVSSISDEGIGKFTINYDDDFSNANYIGIGNCDREDGVTGWYTPFALGPRAGADAFETDQSRWQSGWQGNDYLYDADNYNVIFFSN